MRVFKRASMFMVTVALLWSLALAQTDSFHPKKAHESAEAVRLNNLGVAYMNQQRLQQALELFQQATELGASLEEARLNQAIALLNLQRHEEAGTILLELAEERPEEPRVWYNLGLLYRAQGKPAPALEAFDHVAQLDPDDANVHYFRGLSLSQLQRYPEAIASFQRAIELDRFHVSAEFGLARAYQRAGDAARARLHLSRFQQLTQENLGAPISLIYGEQGKYSLAVQIRPAAEAAPPAIEVQFEPVEPEVGLDFEHSGWRFPERLELERPSAGAHDLAAFFGSGACVLDFDADGAPDLFFVNSGENARGALYRNDGQGSFTNATEESGLDARGHGLGCAVGDYDNDGWADLVVGFLGRLALYRNRGDGTFSEVTDAAGVKTTGFPLGLTFVDYDHDGDLDLYVARFVGIPETETEESLEFPFGLAPTTNILWRNNGNGTFTDRTTPTGLAGTAPTVAAVLTDFDNDRAVDLVLTGWRSAPAVLANPREGQFKLHEPWAEAVPAPTAGAVVLDFNKDGWMDLAFTHWGPPGLTLWKNLEGRRFERVELPESGWKRAWGIAAIDYDNDGWIDIAAVGEKEEEAGIRLWRNLGPAGFRDVSEAVGLNSFPLKDPRSLLTTDYDGDGDADLLITQNAGPVHLLRNDGGNRNSWLHVSLQGRADNTSAIGTKVEVYAGPGWQKWEVAGGSGYLGQSQLDITAGLGPAGEVEIVRLLWPTGVLQDEIQIAARATHPVSQIDRRGSSCPILFAWNGERYEFVSDIIGAAIVGHWVGPGQRNVPDPDEYVKIPGEMLQPRHGRLSFRFLEPMEELIYLDQVRLLAVDHPAEVAVYPNEYFAATIPPPEFKVVASRGARPPRGAWDHDGRDVLDLLLESDRRYVEGFELAAFKGFAELHALELDLGDWDASRPLRLILRGFIEYFTANSVYAAHQADVYAVVPYVEALDGSGQWVRVIDDMGFPAGLARTMVADLTGRVPPGTRRIRIVTNLQIYWDQILVDNSPADLPVELREVPLAEGRLRFLGFPRAIEREPKGDLTYIYEEISASGPYARPRGSYTRFGDALPLLTDIDDRYAIFGPGEEVALEFNPAGLPPLREGWQRDYFFFADGFVKDMDFYEAHALSVAPLPFHSMGSYPYPRTKSYPADERMLDYHFDYNVRHLNRRPAWLYRFDYKTDED